MDLKYRGIQYETHEKLYLAIIKLFHDKIIYKDEFKKKLDEIGIARKEMKELNLIKFWKNFNEDLIEPKDVPNMYVYGETYQKYVIPALIRNGAIPKKDIKNEHFYYGEWRRGNFAKFNIAKNHFEIWRNKFDHWYLDQANHFEDDDNMALFVPLKEITEYEFNNRELK